MQRNTINRDFVFSADFLARKARHVRHHQLFRETLILVTFICIAGLALDSVARAVGM